MKRTILKDRVLPTYSKGEEIFNMVSHIVGGSLGPVAIVLGVIISAIHHNGYGIASSIVFGCSLIILYSISSIYHGLSCKTTAKKVFQILDHCSIFVLIAGTYTPFLLCTLRAYNVTFSWILFGIIWGVSALGITLNSIDLKKYKVFSMICYLLLGWCIIVKTNIIISSLGISGFLLLLSGGLCYTIGAIFYIIGKKKKWMHSIFHLLCIFGSILHLLCILLYVL